MPAASFQDSAPQPYSASALCSTCRRRDWPARPRTSRAPRRAPRSASPERTARSRPPEPPWTAETAEPMRVGGAGGVPSDQALDRVRALPGVILDPRPLRRVEPDEVVHPIALRRRGLHEISVHQPFQPQLRAILADPEQRGRRRQADIRTRSQPEQPEGPAQRGPVLVVEARRGAEGVVADLEARPGREVADGQLVQPAPLVRQPVGLRGGRPAGPGREPRPDDPQRERNPAARAQQLGRGCGPRRPAAGRRQAGRAASSPRRPAASRGRSGRRRAARGAGCGW